MEKSKNLENLIFSILIVVFCSVLGFGICKACATEKPVLPTKLPIQIPEYVLEKAEKEVSL